MARLADVGHLGGERSLRRPEGAHSQSIFSSFGVPGKASAVCQFDVPGHTTRAADRAAMASTAEAFLAADVVVSASPFHVEYAEE